MRLQGSWIRCKQYSAEGAPQQGDSLDDRFCCRARRFRDEARIELPVRPSSLGWLDVGCLGPCLLVASGSGVSVFARLRGGRWAELARRHLDAAGATGWSGVLGAGCIVVAEGRQLLCLGDLCRRVRRCYSRYLCSKCSVSTLQWPDAAASRAPNVTAVQDGFVSFKSILLMMIVVL